jgi:hypothetical protein
MSRLPINPAFDRSAHTRRGLRIALAVGLGTLAMGIAAGALAASGNHTARASQVRHVETANAMAPSSLRAADLFADPTMAPEPEGDPTPTAAPTAAAEPAETEHESASTDHKNGVPPPSDDSPSSRPTGGAQPKPKPSPEPSDHPEPTPSPRD